MNTGKRPVYLNLFKIKLPIGGIVSIIHRVTGVILVAMLPLSIYLLEKSLASEQGFRQVSQWLSAGWIKLVLLLMLAILAQHLFSGIRHLLLDIDIGVGRLTSRATAWLSLGLTLITVIAIGVNWC